jgi:RecA/RadA recombinase
MPARVFSIETPEGALRLASDDIADNFGRWLRFVDHTEGKPIELQAIDVPAANYGARSRFAHARTLVEATRLLEEADKWKAPGVFTIVNDIDPAVATRDVAGKWHDAKKGVSTTDRDILARATLFVDVDAKRVRGTSATDEEIAQTAEVATLVYMALAGIVGAEVLGYGHSGNGRSVFVALDHIAETSELEAAVKGILAALGCMFVAPRVEIDPVVCDAKRLGPAWGTTKRKGAPGIAERPHRRTVFVCAEQVRRLAFPELRDLLATLRAELTDEQRTEVDRSLGVRPSRAPTASGVAPRGIGAFDRANAVSIEQVAEWLGLVEPTGVRCPGCGVQGNSSVAFVGNGLKCLHATCAQKGKPTGFRTPVDLVAECRSISPREAVELMAEHFHFEGFAAKQQSNGAGTPEEERAAVDSYEADERAALQSEPPHKEEAAPKPPTWKTPAVRALLLGNKGVRIPLGIDTLDKACRGGLLTGKVVIIGGAPGAGKTTLAAQKALELAQGGVHVAILAADEEADGLLIRIGQNLSLSREDLESGNDAAKRQLSEWVKPLPLMLFDSDEDEVTIEIVAAELAKGAKGAPSALFIDSIQTARSAGSNSADSPRARADEIMRAVKQAAKQYGHLVIALREVSRGWYRTASDRIDPLAAFKESGGIEYGAAVAIAMANVKGEDDLVDVVIAKNRQGQKPPFRVMLSFARARFSEVPIEPDEPEDEDEREAARIEKARNRVLFALAKVSTLTSKTAVCKRARGNRKDNMKAFDELVVEGLVVLVGGAYRPYRPVNGARSGVENG